MVLTTPKNSTDSTSEWTSEAQFFMRESSTSRVRNTALPLVSSSLLRNSLIALLALFGGNAGGLRQDKVLSNTHDTFLVLTSSTISKIVSQSGSDMSPLVAFSGVS